MSANLPPKNNSHFSNKVLVISFLMAVSIIYQHTKYSYTGISAIDNIRDFAFFLWMTCVPMFFAISGYLFFRGFSLDQVKGKLKRRIKSLLVPYLVWNILYVAFMVIMNKLGLIKEISISTDPAGLVIGVLNSECAPLWFVRYLMLFVCIAPLTYFVLRNRIIGALLIMAMFIFNIYNSSIGAFGNGIDVNANTLVMFNYQFVYFATGAYAALCWSNQIENVNYRNSWIAFTGILIVFVIYWIYLREHGTAVTNHFFRWLWIPLFWFAYDLLPEIKVRPWMRLAFFIYCAHMFIIYCAQGILEILNSRLGAFQIYFEIAEYILIGVATVYFLIIIAKPLKRFMPKIFSLATGGRG